MAVHRMGLLFCTFLALGAVSGKTEGVRLCGKRLADLLRIICERHGGFHAPLLKRDGTGSEVSSSNFRAYRRSDVKPFLFESGEILSTQQKGIVDECCKKQCTLPTLVSYCANANYIGNINLHDILASSIENLASEPENSEKLDPSLQDSSEMNPVPVVHHVRPPKRPASNRRPNLGLSNRDRSVFIVSPKLQTGEQALGEYRF